jgi:hypothetical protein
MKIMESKKIRDLIITLIVLIVGIKLLVVLGLSYISSIGFMAELTGSLEPLGNVLIIGLAFLIIILVPFYLSKRSEEKKGKAKPKGS